LLGEEMDENHRLLGLDRRGERREKGFKTVWKERKRD